MVNICLEHLDSPKAWRGEDLKNDPSWILQLDGDDIAELESALAVAKKSGLPFPRITRAEFPLKNRLMSKLTFVLDELYSGRGFLVVRGLPVEKYTDDEVKLMYWGLCRYIGGKPLYQSTQGAYLTNVRDRGEEYGKINIRGNGTNAYLPYHNDKTDIIGLMCLRKALSGGFSSIVSAVAIHNEILAHHPEYLGLYYSGFYYIIREQALTEKGHTERPIPVFSYRDGVLSSRFLRNQINAGAVKRGIPFTKAEQAALDYFDELTQRPDLNLAMDLQLGDIQFCNNFTVLHSRTEFVDGPEIGQKRHMLRLWFKFPEPLQWPIDEEYPPFNGYALAPNASMRLEA